MTLEEGLVCRDIFHADNVIASDLNDLINQKERIAVGQELTDTVDVHHGLAIGVIDGCLHLVLLDVLTDHACELIVDLMSWTGSDDASTDRFANQGNVANHIQQLVARRLVVEY